MSMHQIRYIDEQGLQGERAPRLLRYLVACGADEFSITVGVPFSDSKWFRGRDTVNRHRSTCPDPACCKRPDGELATRWQGKVWTSAKLHAHILSPLPSGTFPGVDDQELYRFLETHATDAPVN